MDDRQSISHVRGLARHLRRAFARSPWIECQSLIGLTPVTGPPRCASASSPGRTDGIGGPDSSKAVSAPLSNALLRRRRVKGLSRANGRDRPSRDVMIVPRENPGRIWIAIGCLGIGWRSVNEMDADAELAVGVDVLR